MKWIEQEWNIILDYLTKREIWESIGQGLIKVFLIILLAFIATRAGRSLIRKVFKQRSRGPFRITERREATLSKLLENTLTYIVYFAAFIMMLETIGIKVGALLAGAGIAGLAIGFGAQNLVRDIITGFFIIFEDQFSVGDYIRTSNAEGFVEEIGIRTTKVKSWTGELHIIPNGNITDVTNFSVHNSMAVVDISIAYEGDIELAEKVLGELIEELPLKYEQFTKTPELLGVQTLGASEVVLRVVAEVQPMTHWKMARVIRREAKLRLDERGIEIPFPRLVMYSRQEEEPKMNEVNGVKE